MSTMPLAAVSRRRFLAGVGATSGAVLLGACGSTASDGGAPSPTTTGGELSLVQFFGGVPMLAAGSEVRAPFGVGDSHGLLAVDATPAELEVTIVDAGGARVGSPITLTRHAEGLPRAYYPLRFEVAEAGIYTGRVELDGQSMEMAIKVDAAADIEVIQAGDRLPSLTLPTADETRGVNPICTNDPVCPLHDTTASEVLAAGRPLALLVATPAFCQVAICGPVLDVLLGVTDKHPDISFLHAEVYMHPDVNLDEQAPVVAELGLAFEPCLVLVGSEGTVVERIDTIFDAGELDAVLTRLA